MPFDTIRGDEGVPPEPKWSELYPDETDRKSAHFHWGVITREMVAEGILTSANGSAIRRLVDFQVQYERAARHVALHGVVTPAPQASIGQWNPYWSAMKQASDELRSLESALGLTPTMRGRAKVVKREKKVARQSDAYLKSVS